MREGVSKQAPTAVVYHADSVLHDPGESHPEAAVRAQSVFDYLQVSAPAGSIDFMVPLEAAPAVVAEVHSKDYIRSIEADCASGRRVMDQGDTRACRNSYRVAMLAAGSAIAAINCVFNGGYRAAFSCMRPPGHHARPNLTMGFCFSTMWPSRPAMLNEGTGWKGSSSSIGMCITEMARRKYFMRIRACFF